MSRDDEFIGEENMKHLLSEGDEFKCKNKFQYDFISDNHREMSDYDFDPGLQINFIIDTILHIMKHDNE